MSDTTNKSEQKPEFHLKVVTFEGIEGIREADFFEPETRAWLDEWNAKAKKEAARRWAKKHPNPILRRALSNRIRLGSEALKRDIRRKRWQMALTTHIQQWILERAAQPALFPLLLDALVIREEVESDATA